MSLKQKIAESSLLKAFIPAVLSVGIGIFSGSLITEISGPEGLSWNKAPRTPSFVVLVALTAVQIWFSRWVYVLERDVMKFAEVTYCKAYIRSRLLPDAATRMGEQIRNGHGGEFRRAMDEIEEVLK